MQHLGDITKINGAEVPVVDCITGGSPCLDLSIAGKRAGLEGERSGLFMEQIRIVKEMREHDRRTNHRAAFNIRPRYMVWENVPGAFSSNKGQDFQAVLSEIVRIANPEAPDVPLPDRGGRWDKAGGIFGYSPDGIPFSICWRVHDAQFWGVPQRRKRIALVADFGGFSASEILFEREGVRGDFEKSGAERQAAARGATNSLGNAISFQERAGKPGGGKGILIQNEHTGALSTFNNQSVFCIEGHVIDRDTSQNGIGVREGSSHTLNATDRHAVVQIYDARGNGDGETVCTLTGDHQNRVTDYTALCIGNGQANQSVSDKAGALNTMHDQQAVMSQTVVRRLTPLEAERLQGYPDGWTYIGEWTDSKGKKHKPADSPRYKALGNSIALPFWFWLLRRISAQYERPATMASLFDGIGGFPLCWEKCNGKGSALWASEIEEFPIAVTKRRFSE